MSISTITNKDNLVVIPNNPSDAYQIGYSIGYQDGKCDAASPWHRVENGLPKKAGEYIVAYHPCWWNDVKTSVTEIGIDTFRGKTSWAKRKFQRVTHWMEKPEPPKEGNDA